jgi:transcriptional pleiotropic regulator of transition state genes
MKGISRKIDDLGRITLPISYRKPEGLKQGSPVGMLFEGNSIRLVTRISNFHGMVRHLDELGRLCIPKEYRIALRIGQNDLVDMYIDGEEICIKRAELQCVICGSEDGNLLEVDGVLICRKCALKLQDKLMEV